MAEVTKRKLDRGKRLRWLGMGVALLISALISLDFLAVYDLEKPLSGPWKVDSEGYSEIRDGSFDRLLANAGVGDPHKVLLKVYFGWSQDVSIAMIDQPVAGPKVLISEYDFQSRQSIARSFNLSRIEMTAFLSRFDDAALGYRIMRLGFDGRGVSFERRFSDRIVSYEGNASFSSQDAALARIVDQLIVKHGGYTWLRPDASGESWTRAELGIPASRP